MRFLNTRLRPAVAPVLFALRVVVASASLPLSLTIHDIDGVDRSPLQVARGHASALFFITQDCPISNYYSHEIHRICDEYGKRGVGCALVYVDPTLTDEQARKHSQDYGHGDYPKIIDRNHDLVKATGVTITPEVVIAMPDGSFPYRGRIDDYYAALGKPRRIVTEHNLRDALDAVLTGKPVSKPEVKPVGCYIPSLAAYGITR